MLDMISMMNIVIIFTMFLAVGVLITVFYEIIKFNFKEISLKGSPLQKEKSSEDYSINKGINQLNDQSPSDLISKNVEETMEKSPSLGSNNVPSSNTIASELSKSDDVEALLKGASKEQNEDLINIRNSKMEENNKELNSKIEENQVSKEEDEQLSEVENLLKVKQPKDEALEISRQLHELNEYVKKLRDSLKNFTKSE